ncbi:MAG: alpha-N-arabinofuranosidase [bacterium]
MKAQLIVNRNFVIDAIDPRIYGGFIEHLGRAVYDGIYEPGHPTADADGFRQDVIGLVKELDMPVTRYPGGNFVSGYNWEDGVGPREQRPVRLDLAWKALEPNQVGTNEFMRWCAAANTRPIMAVNLGTHGPAEAQALVEYCNHPAGTYWSDLRRQHGVAQPHGIKLWCLGNEMDGHWQTGHKTAEEYGRVALEAAKMMKWTDPRIELVVCGSSADSMATFGQWETTVLEHTYDLVEHLSIHQYYGNGDQETPGFLAESEHLDRFIKSAVALCDAVGARKRSSRKLQIAVDEWNVWFHSYGQEKHSPEWTVARPILEDVYTMEDALLVGSLLITLLNNADRVKVACLAQTVNVIAPIMTRKGGGAWRQTIFFPFLLTSRHGRGVALRQVVESPVYDTVFANKPVKNVPYLASAVVYDAAAGEVKIFAVNRSLDQTMELEVHLQGLAPSGVLEWQTLHHADLKAANREGDERVRPVVATGATLVGERLQATLPPASWNLLRVQRQPT